MPATLLKPLAMVLLLGGALAACSRFRQHAAEEEPLPVKKVEEEIIVAAWAEPPRLPAGGGSAHLLVRVQKRGGAAYPGVEVRFRASTGSLYSGGSILVTDRQGLSRDRVTTQHSVTITLNAGGTRYRFRVPVGEASSP
jgi:hypothetical protein